jgi:hypothetical protein
VKQRAQCAQPRTNPVPAFPLWPRHYPFLLITIGAQPVCPKSTAWCLSFAFSSSGPRAGCLLGSPPWCSFLQQVLIRGWALRSPHSPTAAISSSLTQPTPNSKPQLHSSGISLGGHIWAKRGENISPDPWPCLQAWPTVHHGPGKCHLPLDLGPTARPRGCCHFCQRGEVIIVQPLPSGHVPQSSRGA